MSKKRPISPEGQPPGWDSGNLDDAPPRVLDRYRRTCWSYDDAARAGLAPWNEDDAARAGQVPPSTFPATGTSATVAPWRRPPVLVPRPPATAPPGHLRSNNWQQVAYGTLATSSSSSTMPPIPEAEAEAPVAEADALHVEAEADAPVAVTRTVATQTRAHDFTVPVGDCPRCAARAFVDGNTWFYR